MDLKPSTKNQYAGKLCVFLADETPAAFLSKARANSKDLAIEIKIRLGKIRDKSPLQAHLTRYALKSFLEFYETDVHLNSKFRVRRVRKKSEFTWHDAERIIAETDEPYRSLFSFMLWAGLGEDEIAEIQQSAEILESIKRHRTDEKPYIRVDLSPRKSTLDGFFTLIPKQRVPEFPLYTKTYKNRGSKLITGHDMQNVWRRAAKKIGLWHVGLGPHHLRSAFRSGCNPAGVGPYVSEFVMGHGAAEQYGYSRPTEEQAAKELGKLWEQSKPATASELQQRDQRIAKMEQQMKDLSATNEFLMRFAKESGRTRDRKLREILRTSPKWKAEATRHDLMGKSTKKKRRKH